MTDQIAVEPGIHVFALQEAKLKAVPLAVFYRPNLSGIFLVVPVVLRVPHRLDLVFEREGALEEKDFAFHVFQRRVGADQRTFRGTVRQLAFDDLRGRRWSCTYPRCL
ncbi:MAG: hypothetical protein ACREJM_13980, partial [Candidatus Saccharimonadales bacterium]